MENNQQRRGRHDGVNEDYPIYSRLFIVCGKNVTETQLREDFSKFGTIENFFIPQDQNTGSLKGIAYIKYSKTSEAAQALQALHMTALSGSSRPIKVMVATSRSDIQTDDSSDDPEKYRRLFLNVQKSMTEEELKEYFSQFGSVTSVMLQRDRDTCESKGFAYITYKTFYQAALAFEEAERKYRPIFAQPKKQHRRPETSFEANLSLASNVSLNNTLLPMMNVQPQGYKSVIVNCAPFLTNYHIQNLFDLVPGMVKCHYAIDLMGRFGKGTITYSSPVSAAYAVQKLDGFEYPPGQQIMVKPDYSRFNPDQSLDRVPALMSNLNSAMSKASNSSTPDFALLATAVAEASKLIKTATLGITDQDIPDSNDLSYCSVQLPPPQPLAHIDAQVAKRCFLVCKPQPPPLKVLRDVFCRFGDMITVYTLPNKTVGYVRYASVRAADEAMKTLHGAELCGIRIKVLEAEDEDRPAQKRTRYN